MSRRSVFSFIFIVILLGAGLFAWQVFSYYQKIVNGTITTADFPTLAFTDKLTSSRITRAAVSETSEVVDVVTDDDPSLGSLNAPLTIVEFADFACPYSQEVSYAIRRIAQTFGSTVRYIYRDFPLSEVHPDAELAAEAGNCANEQDHFWEFHDKLFANQQDLSRTSLLRYAEQVGMSKQKFESCLNSGKFKGEVAEDLAAGEKAGVYGTPTFFFNGHKVEGAIPENVLNQIVAAFSKGG